jgi:hypothetical protein
MVPDFGIIRLITGKCKPGKVQISESDFRIQKLQKTAVNLKDLGRERNPEK